jgi:hypothetical protein
LKLFVFLSELQYLFIKRHITHSLTRSSLGFSSLWHVETTLSLNVLSHKSSHLRFLNHAISVDIEFLEENIELFNSHRGFIFQR